MLHNGTNTMAKACGVKGCNYIVGNNGSIKRKDTKDIVAMEIEDLKLHIEMKYRIPAEQEARDSTKEERENNKEEGSWW